MHLHGGLLKALVSAYIEIADLGTGSLRYGRPRVPSARDILEQVIVESIQRGDALDIYDRRFATYLYRLTGGTDLKVRADRGYETRTDDHIFLDIALEALRCYVDLVRAKRQKVEKVAAVGT